MPPTSAQTVPPLSGGRMVRTPAVIDLPAAPVQIVHHRVIARRCPRCRRTVTPTLDLGEAVVDRQRLGIDLINLIVTLREVGRLPVRTSQWELRVVHGLALSVGAITAASDRVATVGDAALIQIREALRARPVGHRDAPGGMSRAGGTAHGIGDRDAAPLYGCGGLPRCRTSAPLLGTARRCAPPRPALRTGHAGSQGSVDQTEAAGGMAGWMVRDADPVLANVPAAS